jgi:hypothetical protein
MLYYFKARVPTCFNFNFLISKPFFNQLQAMFICYPTIYDMTMLALVYKLKKHLIYADILDPRTQHTGSNIKHLLCEQFKKKVKPKYSFLFMILGSEIKKPFTKLFKEHQ